MTRWPKVCMSPTQVPYSICSQWDTNFKKDRCWELYKLQSGVHKVYEGEETPLKISGKFTNENREWNRLGKNRFTKGQIKNHYGEVHYKFYLTS